jgi:hypothetical protein
VEIFRLWAFQFRERRMKQLKTFFHKRAKSFRGKIWKVLEVLEINWHSFNRDATLWLTTFRRTTLSRMPFSSSTISIPSLSTTSMLYKTPPCLLLVWMAQFSQDVDCCYVKCHYTKCCYAKWHYAECRYVECSNVANVLCGIMMSVIFMCRSTVSLHNIGCSLVGTLARWFSTEIEIVSHL